MRWGYATTTGFWSSERTKAGPARVRAHGSASRRPTGRLPRLAK